MSLGSHFNVWNTCLHILRNRGYSLRVEGYLDEDGGWPSAALWIAEKDSFVFKGDNPIELLGLVGIYDQVQPAADVPYWWRVNFPDIRWELMTAAFPEAGIDR